MSLDVSLTIPGETVMKPAQIFLRDGGQNRPITRAEWDEKFPGTEPAMVVSTESDEVYSANITHNLGAMAKEAGIYQHLWRPDEIGITKAAELIVPLMEGLRLMRTDPERFRKHNAKNGWGTYEQFVPWIDRYIEACRQHPDATVTVSR